MNDEVKDTIRPEDMIIVEDTAADKQDISVILDENTILLPAGDAYSLIDMDALEELVDKSGLSYQDISEMKDISISAIYKFFSRRSKNPSFYNVMMILDAVGATVDEIRVPKRKSSHGIEEYLAQLSRMETMIAELQKTVESQSRHIEELTSALRNSQ